MLELMKEYNEIAKRYKDADEYFKRTDVSLEKKIAQANNIAALIKEMVRVSNELNLLLGEPMTEQEYFEGFVLEVER